MMAGRGGAGMRGAGMSDDESAMAPPAYGGMADGEEGEEGCGGLLLSEELAAARAHYAGVAPLSRSSAGGSSSGGGMGGVRDGAVL